jgi:hypothetical protein
MSTLITVDDLLGMTRSQLYKVLADGHPIEPNALDDCEYNGISLGLPPWMEKLSWKKFKKVFHRDPTHGGLRGWNVAAVQNGLDEDWIDATRKGQPQTYWHYVVVSPGCHPLPGPYEKGLLIHYGWGGNNLLSTMHVMRDPLLAVNPDSADLLLGYSYVEMGWFRFNTPTFFALVRGKALTHLVPSPRPQQFSS